MPRVQFVKSSRARKVNRRGIQDLRMRQVDSLQVRGLDACLFDEGSKLQLVKKYLKKPSLGLEQSLYERRRDSAWFASLGSTTDIQSVSVVSQLRAPAKGMRNFIDMALTSHISHEPQILFSRTILAILAVPDDVMVTEHLFLASPLSQTPSNRFGQLSGTLGYSYYWSTTDWLPLLVSSDEVADSCIHSLDAFPMVKLLRFFSVSPAALSDGKHLDTSRA
ncbi:hypothetical protein FA10DRAFT_291988 [Acaromyces ingoldii]|uniref:Uncharacterized protein n=1 Tax=Acaromyces ingoldii TaxID=215250 RepID=A0A316YC44_9BASI|nr:hypothetical protein FA10DRAFT_291988 [Acaromyces ingoldii]PWN86474.1 hypothetical protein FA10DRAFT_291988 [Acaromyces ingoldii]